MRILLQILLLAVTSDMASSARILAVLPMPARSHHQLFRAVLKTLAERGHQIVSYTPLLMDKPVPNYTEIHLDTVQSVEKTFTVEHLKKALEMSPIAVTPMIWKEVSKTIEEAANSSKFQELLASEEKFDLVIIEAFFGQESLVGFGHKFNAPVISFQPFGSFCLINKVMGNSLSLAYIPDFSLPYSHFMSFYERCINAYSQVKTLYQYYNDYLPSQIEIIKKLYKDPTMPSLINMLHNISLVVNNAHPFVHYSQSYTPNIAPVGGIHLQKEIKALPVGMKKYLDEAKHGVIYLALGSVLPDHLLPQSHFDNFINVFRRLPQRVLWKTTRDLKGLPDNIMTAKWVPQQDVLAHPNVVLFMTHGGLFSQHEAIAAGVPVVCTPFFGDQPMNAKFYEEKGIGVRLLYDTLSEQTIHSAITSVLNSSKYKENALRLSRIYKDRPLSPADSLVFWVEYVLRHGGAPHLRPASAHMAWYQLALLDVVATIVLSVAVLLLIPYMIIRIVFRCLIKRKNLNEKKRK